MWVGIGVGIGRNRFATGIFDAYALRVTGDGGITEAGQCVDAVSGILLNASLLLIPSGYKGGKLYAEIPTNGNGDLTWTRGSDAFRTNASGVIQRVPWNLLSYSEDFSNIYWSKDAGVTVDTNVDLAPNGTTTADRLNLSTNGAVYRSGLSFGTGSFTLSVWLKGEGANIGKQVLLEFTNGNSTVTLTGDWQRFTTTGTNVINVAIKRATSGQATAVLAWGIQVVEGTTAQTYLPTTDRLNFPRLSYMYGSCPSALLEPQRTNLLTYSQAFNDATWAKVASIGGSITATDNYNASPDGNTNASRLLITNLNSAYIAKSFTSVNGSSYTISIWAKSNTASSYTFQLRDGYSGVVSSNLTVTPTWQRFTLTFTASGTTAELQFRTLVVGSYDLSIYGAQAELGAYPTTYIPTTSATATRVADSSRTTGRSSLIGQSEGTLFLDLYYLPLQNQARAIAITETSVPLTNRLIININNTNNRVSVISRQSGSLTNGSMSESPSTVLLNGRNKIALGYKSGDSVLYINGVQVATNTDSFTFSATLNDIFLMTSEISLVADNVGFVNISALFTTRLTNTQLATLTT